MAKTLQDCYNIAYGIIAQAEDSTSYPVDLLTTFINKAQNDICYGNVHNLSTNERLEKQALTFLEKNQFYTTHNYGTLTNNAIVGNTTVDLTNSLATAGLVWINGDLISYTGNTGTQLTGIPISGDFSIQFIHKAGTQVFQLDTLPSDYGQLSRVYLTLDNTYTRKKLIGIDDRDLSSPVVNSYLNNFFQNKGQTTGLYREYYYSIIRGKYILYLVPQVNGQAIGFEYQKAPTQLVDVTDVVTIPDNYSMTTIPQMAISEMLANRGDLDEAYKINNFGFNNIKSMYQFYTTQRKELEYNQRVRNSSEGYLAI